MTSPFFLASSSVGGRGPLTWREINSLDDKYCIPKIVSQIVSLVKKERRPPTMDVFGGPKWDIKLMGKEKEERERNKTKVGARFWWVVVVQTSVYCT